MHALSVAAMFLLGVFGCRTQRSLEEVESALGTLEASGSEAVLAQTALQRGLQRLEALFIVRASAQADAVRETVTLSADSTPESFRDWPLELEQGECIAIWAFAEADGLDIDLEVHNPTGWVELQETGTDAMPVVPEYCAQAPGPHVVRLVAATGSGEAAVAVRRWPDDAFAARAALDEALDAHGAPAAVLRRWPMQRTRLQELGALEAPAVLAQGGCYWAVAWSADEAHDVDLEWLDAAGSVLMRDISTDRSPVTGPLCGDEPRLARLRVKMYSGSGDVWWRIVHTEARVEE